MPVQQFPDPHEADADGILAVGGDLHPLSLLLAYRDGIFPWPIEGLGLTWFSPDPRAILDFSFLHVSKSLEKARRRGAFHFTMDKEFSSVIGACAQQERPGQSGTWITPELKTAYEEMHRLGYAHSVEVWEGEELVGGIYGLAIQGAFSAESMFYRKTNASKLALLYLADHLTARGLKWIDIQMMTPHMERLGAIEISRIEFLKRLRHAQSQKLALF